MFLGKLETECFLYSPSETYLKLEPLVDLNMFLLLEDESGRRRVAGTKGIVDDFFCGGVQFKEGDLEVMLDAKKRNLIELGRQGTVRLVIG